MIRFITFGFHLLPLDLDFHFQTHQRNEASLNWNGTHWSNKKSFNYWNRLLQFTNYFIYSKVTSFLIKLKRVVRFQTLQSATTQIKCINQLLRFSRGGVDEFEFEFQFKRRLILWVCSPRELNLRWVVRHSKFEFEFNLAHRLSALAASVELRQSQ